MIANEQARNRRYRAQLVLHAIETLAPDAPLLAPRLARYAQAEGLSWAGLSALLGTTQDGLNHIALCRPPRPDSFVSDVEAIAREYIAPDRLLNLLRQLQILEVFADRAAETTTPYDVNASGGMLLAARDREESRGEKEKSEDGEKTEEAAPHSIENPNPTPQNQETP